MKHEIRRIVRVSQLALFGAILGSGQVSVLTQHNDNARTGQNLSETVLNTSNVNQNTFGKLFWRTVDGFIYAQPLYVQGLSIQGATHNVVYVATQHNSVYAFDADNPNAPAPLWQVNLGTPVPSQDICILTGDTNPQDCPYYDISPEIGITSTPVIDTGAPGIIYVVNRTKDTSNGTYHDYLHALSLTTGVEQLGGPVEITGQVSGTGDGSSGGIVTFDPTYHHQRPALLLVNGVLYLAFGSVGDIGTWHGWVMSYNASTLKQEAIFNVAPDGSEGGIWSAGQGPVADTTGNVYIMTGNGDFNANVGGGRNYGDSFVKFGGSSLAVSDYFTPSDQGTLNADNTDLGSGGPMLMPGTSLLVGMGKDGIFRVVNSNDMGKYNSGADNDVQEFTATPNPFYSSPVYWNSPNNGPVVYIWGAADYLKAYQFTGSKFNTTPVSQGTIQNSTGESNAAALSVSANASQQGSGILWSSASVSQWASGVQVSGVVRAFDATDLATELWDSTQNLARDDVGNSAKYNPPTIANGKVYVGSFSGQLQVYGLNPPPFQGIQFVQVASATPQSTTASVSVTYPGSQTTGDLNVVIVGWNDSTATVQSVTDSAGNSYSLAIGPTTGTALRQSIYYAKNITGRSGNTVTVTFNQSATKPDIRILEYSGVDTANPLDVSAGASGSSNVADSGFVATTAANELIVGANTVHSNTTVMAGAPFTPRVITTSDSDFASDRLVNVPGSYHSWAPLNASGAWVDQVVTFRAAAASTVPFVDSVSPNSGPAAGGTAVTIAGTNFAAGATVTFGATAATNVAVVNSTTITATTPAGSAGAVTVTVTVNGQSGSLTNGFTYVAAPTVSSVSPNSGSALGGTAVTITGSNFASGATVTFGATAATNVVVVSSTQITATTPAGTAGAVTVTVTNVGSQSGSLASGFTYVVAPTVSSISPNNGPQAGGTAVTITGTNFASGATVKFGSTAATNVVVVSSTTITATTPAESSGAVTVTVTVNGQSGSLTNGYTYTGTVAIGFAQVAAATPQSPTATVSVSYPAAQTAGDLNVVVVGWNDTTSTVQSVKDSGGNSYSLAIGLTVGTGLQQSIYYASRIVGGSNTVTVTFSQAAAYPDVRILEYRGVTALDVTAGASGSSTAANSGAATTTSANELIFGANTVATGNKTVGTGFTSRIITSPDGDLAEDKIVTTAGSNSATATLTASGPWVMQMATFLAVSGPAPTVTSVSPNSGSTAGGTAVTITGTNFATGATVTFGTAAATNVAVVNSTTITATTPAGSAGAVTVTVTVNGQSGSLAGAFTYNAPPTVSSVSPNSGSTAGGTAVTITGTNFASGATVTFGSTAATNVVVVNATSITATTPAGSAGAVTVTVTVSGQSGSLANGFTYTATVTTCPQNLAIGAYTLCGEVYNDVSSGSSVSVTYSPVSGNGIIAWATWCFTSSCTTSTAGVTATIGDNVNATESCFVASPHSPFLTDANGGAQGSGDFQGHYVWYCPSIPPGVTTFTVTPSSSSLSYIQLNVSEWKAGSLAANCSPISNCFENVDNSVSAGNTTGGTTASVTTNGSTVNANDLIFAGTEVPCCSFTASPGTGYTGITVAPSVTPGMVSEAKAATATGIQTATTTWTGGSTPWFGVIVPLIGAGAAPVVPTVATVSPNNGPAAGGTAVTITGTNFAAGATVTFGGTPATNVVVVSGTQITATTPAGTAGAVTVTVTVSGQSGSLTNGFTYVVAPTVSSVSPNSGSTAGGTAVTITGTNFASGATVKFGATAATNVVVVNGTTITATTPAGSAGAVTVAVTVSGQSGSLTNGFTYVAAPTVSSVSPNSGSTAGGTAVTITGTNFASGATVTFGGTAATNVVVVNGTTITATTPAGSAGAATVTVTVSGQSGSLAGGYTYVLVGGITAPGNFVGALVGTSVPTYVAGQQYYNATAGTSFTSSSFNSTGADLLVMFVGCHNQTVFTITDSFGNTWLPLAGPAYKVGSAYYPMEGEFFYAPNAKTGTGHTITVSLSQSEPLVMSIAALSGDNVYSPIDAYSSITGDNGTIAKYIASSPLTTFQPNDLLLGIVKGFGSQTYTVGTGYTAQAASTGLNFSAETGTAAGPGSYSSSFTATIGDFWQSVIAAIAPSPTQTVLSWTASTGAPIANYLIERCAGLGCSSFSQIASVSGSTLTYPDATISSGTVYNYRVRAVSGGTFSPYSTVQAVSPIIPHVVSSFSSATPTRTVAAWDASAESGGAISQYSIERCTGLGCSAFSQIATTSNTSYTDTSAAAGQTYTYRVRAQDANNFYGPYSVAAAASIPAYFDNAADGGNNNGSTTSLTYLYAVGTNSNRLLLVNVIGDTSVDDISSVTYAGAAMTLITKVQTPGDRWHYLYYLLAPASGTNNVIVTAASSHYLISEATSWYNVAQSGQPEASTTNTAASGVSLTTSLPASSNDAIVAESTWGYTGLISSGGSSALVVDSAFEGLGMFSSVPSPVTQAFPVSMTNTWGGQDSASSIMASFSLASNGTAGITYDNSVDGGNNGGSTTSLTYPYKVGTGSNRLLVVNLIGDPSANDISSVTYAGTPMTLIGQVQAPSNNYQYLYYLLNPASGSNNIVVTAGSSHYLISQAASWYNVKQSAQPDASTTNTAAATSTSITTSLTTIATGSLVVQGLWSYGHLAAGAGATPILTDAAFDGAGIFASSGSPVSPAGNVSMTTISDGAASSGVIMASFAPAPLGAPTVSSVSPNSGSTGGGTAVTITGTNFTSGATVTFGGTAATNVVVVNGTTITATTPARTAGAATVTVTVSGQSGSLTNGFTYVVVPTVSSVSPNSGSTGGGTAVTITGTNFASGATVKFGATAATNVVVVNGTTITATTPAGSAGAVTVTVTVSGQSGSLTNGFTYVAAPTVSSVSPNSGSTAGGTAVTITGTNFASGATVKFGATAATNVVVVNGTTITATTPAGTVGAVTVTVTVSGQSGSLTNGFTYVVVPTVSSVSPNSGSTAGGTAVTITGTNFASGATVTFGGTAATNVVVVNGTTITATTPAGSAGAVTVTVTVSGQSGSLTNGFTYVAAPTVSSVSPNSGSTAGGTAVTITGTNFASGATVKFGATAATNVVVVNGTTITATTPAGSAGAATVTVTVSGQSGSLTNGFTYVVVPTVSSVSPNSGSTAGGTAVTITGTNFASGATVTFGGTAATNVVVVNGTTITATTPAGTVGAVTVTVTVSGQSGSLTNGFTYVAAPTVSSVSPNSGSTAGGTAVTITGTNFASGATVTFGGTAATNVVVVNGTTITATTPAGSAGAVTVTVTVSGQSGSLTNGFTYVVAPTVSSVSPNSGSTAGGTAVTITGTNFASGATVKFGATAATNVVVVNGTTITATTPAGTAGAATVTVTVSGQSGSLTNGFTYVAAPTVSSVSPNSGPTAGGTAVTITGTSFASGATVTFGGTAATNVVVVNGTTITATTPAGSAGAVTVTVTVSGQSGSLTNGFTYVVAPTVSSVSPNSGSTAGGTAVTITGTNFASGATVKFGATAATNVVVVNGTTITATTPAGSAGAVTVTVTVSGQSGSLTNGFTYVVVPTVSSVSPNSGPTAGGTAVTITGTNFAAGATVTFGGTAATNVVVVNGTTITATTPAGSAGAVTVTVTVSGQSGSLTNGFTYTGTVAISFIQVTSATPQTPTTTVPVSYPGAQTAGDLNVVVVGWNDTTATVQSVKDSGGNNYLLAIGPTSGTGLQQSIYYAPNIVGGSNTVTVTFSQAAAYPDIRILEYRGVTAVDVTVGASGSSTAANSGAATTTNANELIFGANTVATGNKTVGTGFKSRIITSPDGDLAEDKIVTAAGSNSATATLSASGPWVMQMVTFK